MIYSLVSGYLFDDFGAKSPFVFLGIIDLSYVLIFVSFMCFATQPKVDKEFQKEQEMTINKLKRIESDVSQ